jgi:uncharacterized membrane protein
MMKIILVLSFLLLIMGFVSVTYLIYTCYSIVKSLKGEDENEQSH